MTDNLHYYMYLIFGMFVRDAIDGDGNNKWNVAPPPDPRIRACLKKHLLYLKHGL